MAPWYDIICFWYILTFLQIMDDAAIDACAHKSIDAARLTEGKGSPIECMTSLYKITIESHKDAINAAESCASLLVENNILDAYNIFVCSPIFHSNRTVH